ncbi:flagellar protein FlgN [Massilia sp. B-10]|nr:flagellar protein FlgN [Massilia sp. B-10]
MPTASAHATVQDELKLISCLIDLMKQEQQFLVAANTDGLNTLTPLKNDLVEQMAALGNQRHQALAAIGAEPSEPGMEAWLARVSNPLYSELWQQLLGKMREAKELNRVNGMLITKQMTQNAILINAMRTPADAADTGFYGPSGQATPVSSKRRLVVG